jgi:hypothetical protein
MYVVIMSILMWILKLFLRQFISALVGEYKNFDNIKKHDTNVKIAAAQVNSNSSTILYKIL